MGKGYAVGDIVTIPNTNWFGGSDIIWNVVCVQFSGGLCGRIDPAYTTLSAAPVTVVIASSKGSIVSIVPYTPQTDPYWNANTYTLATTCIDYRYSKSNALVSCKGSGAQLKVVIESREHTCNTPHAAGYVACSGKLSWISSVTLAAVGSGYNVNDILVVQASSLGVNTALSPSSRSINITIQTVVRGDGAIFSLNIDSNSNIYVSLQNAGTNYSKHENILLMNAAFGSLNMTVLEVVGDVTQAISPVYASAASLGCSVLTPRTGLTKLAFAIKTSSFFVQGTLNAASQASSSGLGSGATFTLTVDATKYLQVAITSQGKNYAVGDKVTINTANTAIGGASAPAVEFRVEEIGGALLSVTRTTEPANDWQVGTHVTVSGSSTSGLGLGAQFKIVYQTSSSISPMFRLTATEVGYGYKTGDTITITTQVATVSNPLVLLVDAVASIPSCPPVLKSLSLDEGSCANCPPVSAGYASYSDSDTVLVKLNPTISGSYQLEVAIGVGHGLLATYYTATPDVSLYSQNSNAVLVVPGIDFSAVSGNPFPNSCTSARFRGFIFPSQAETYTFYLVHKNVNDRAKLWIDGTLLFDSWDSNPISLEFSSTFAFHSANIPFDLHLVYRQVGGSEQSKGLSLKWEHVVSLNVCTVGS